jgi:hypothetical protein
MHTFCMIESPKNALLPVWRLVSRLKAEMMAAQLASVDFDCSRYLPRMGKQYCRDCGLEEPAGRLDASCASC